MITCSFFCIISQLNLLFPILMNINGFCEWDCSGIRCCRSALESVIIVIQYSARRKCGRPELLKEEIVDSVEELTKNKDMQTIVFL